MSDQYVCDLGQIYVNLVFVVEVHISVLVLCERFLKKRTSFLHWQPQVC
jgi:hypothetical protein